MRRRWIPLWAQTIRFRLTVTYSAVLFGLAALLLGGVFLTLRTNAEAAPLNTITVQKTYRDSAGELQIKEGHSFLAADIRSVEAAVNYKSIKRLQTYSLAALGGLFVASLGTGWWLSGRVLRPVRQITTAAQEISATDLSRRIALKGPRDELRTLADTVDGMLGRLEDAFAAQRQMVDDASHELRNPLAVIQANVDAVLADDTATPESRAQASAIVTRALRRMTQLVEDLLASARRSSPAFVDTDVDLAAIAHEAAEEYAVLATRPAAGVWPGRGRRCAGAAAGGRQPAVERRPPRARRESTGACRRQPERLGVHRRPGRRAGDRRR
ncbi:histidine kinase dimerization/phospho-acceptor domain-containing protein [Actinopolymorpha alba]|uniref:histidine kinase dimerization/phospho-acceptor domain-containing protein n=1 Tax=Actinopolymorpha alba TaxID=533267 RepID=UPI0003A8ED04|nr:histidine kinase dimerization/phospho-acceptor domain-containing protein [Actinopolymorpha alba]